MLLNIGPHKLNNASLMDPSVDQMLGMEKVNVLYTDPPWGEGNMKYWVSLAQKQTGKPFQQTTYADLLARIAGFAARYVDGYVFVETGVKWGDQVMKALEPVCHKLAIQTMQYRSGAKLLECVLVSGVTDPAYPALSLDVSGLRGAALPKAVVASVATPGGIVFDPCCGMGYTAKAAVNAGMRFRGNEVNRHRMQDTVDFLTKASK
jgi:hypothetical protein